MDFAFSNEHQRLRVMAPMRPTMRSSTFSLDAVLLRAVAVDQAGVVAVPHLVVEDDVV